MKPISLSALAKFIDLPCDNEIFIHGFSVDSRKVQPKDLFFALPGKKVEGAQFLKEVAAKGAAAAMVKEDFQGESYGLQLLKVPDVLKSLQELARRVLASRSSKVVAITGSLGKTTTKEFISTLLKSSFKIFSSPLSYNSQITLPLSILMAEGDEEILVLEMGMSLKGEMERLVSIAPPDIAILTHVAVQHASSFTDGLAGISREKRTIFSHAKTQLGIFHLDIPHFEETLQSGSCPKKTFSMISPEADFYLEPLSEGVRFQIKGGESIILPVHLPLKPHYQNLLAALALCYTLDVPWKRIEEAAPLLKLPPMRFERVEKKGIVFINDAYNANPDAMKAALEHLPKPSKGGKTFAVLSEMDALGMYSDTGHALVAETALHHVDVLMCIGSRCETMRKIWKQKKRELELFETLADLTVALQNHVKPGDVVLLKGARSYALERILNYF